MVDPTQVAKDVGTGVQAVGAWTASHTTATIVIIAVLVGVAIGYMLHS